MKYLKLFEAKPKESLNDRLMRGEQISDEERNSIMNRSEDEKNDLDIKGFKGPFAPGLFKSKEEKALYKVYQIIKKIVNLDKSKIDVRYFGNDHKMEIGDYYITYDDFSRQFQI